LLYQVFKAGRLPVDKEIATALYVGLVTDTGRFQYSNTTPWAHLMAKELQESGVDVVQVYREVYESVPLPKLRLLGRALQRAEAHAGGTVVAAWLAEEDFTAAGATEGHTEGLVDVLRQAKGARVAVLARMKRQDGRPVTKVSLRSLDGGVDVSAIARQRGGGGHVQAAGFTAEEELAEVLSWTVGQAVERL